MGKRWLPYRTLPPKLLHTLLLIALIVLSAVAVPAVARIIIIIGPKTPNAKSSPGMKITFEHDSVEAGNTLKGVASKFLPGEYVALWMYKGDSSSQLNGGTASSEGKLTFWVDTAAGISAPGKRKVCAQGQRNASTKKKPVACGSFTVEASDDGGGDGTGGGGGYQPPTTGPGYQPPTTGPGYVPPASG